MAGGAGVDREGLGRSKHARSLAGMWRLITDSGFKGEAGGKHDIDKGPWPVGNSRRILRQWTMFVMPSLSMARASVASGR